ncbi:MAG: tetratricopeptide repeat protein [Candidatus Ozemobacteraceae bacterium]
MNQFTGSAITTPSEKRARGISPEKRVLSWQFPLQPGAFVGIHPLRGTFRTRRGLVALLKPLFLGLSLLLAAPGTPVLAQDQLLPLPRPSANASMTAHIMASSSFSLVNEGAKLLSEGQSQKAEEVLLQAVAKYPDLPEAAYNLGLAQAFNERFADAEQAQRRALAKNPRFAAAHLALGNALLSQGRAKEALESFIRAEAVASGDAEITTSATLNRAATLGKLNRYIEAEEAFSDCLARNPDDPTPAFQIGTLKLRQKKWAEALEWLDIASSSLPLEVAVLRAKALVKLTRQTEAKAALEHAEKTLATANVAENVRSSLTQVIVELRSELAALPPGN